MGYSSCGSKGPKIPLEFRTDLGPWGVTKLYRYLVRSHQIPQSGAFGCTWWYPARFSLSMVSEDLGSWSWMHIAHKGCLFEMYCFGNLKCIILAKWLFVNYVQWPVMCKLDYSPLCIERGRCRWGWAAPLLLLAAQQSHASNHPSFKTSLCHEIKCFGKPTTKLDLNLFKCADSYLLFLNCLTLCKVVYGWFGFPPCGGVGESWGWRAKATFVLLLPLRWVHLSIFAPHLNLNNYRHCP